MVAMTEDAIALEKAAARGVSNLSRFHKIILSWDYVSLRQDSTKKGKGREEVLGLHRMKLKFKDVEEYINVFEPLLFEEVKAQITQSSGEEERESKVGTVMSCEEGSEFQMVTMKVKPEFLVELAENDLLFLSKDNKIQEGQGRPTTCCFALVDGRSGSEKIKLKTYLCNDTEKSAKDDIVISCRLRMRSALNETNGDFFIMKVCSLSTIVREYAAMRSISTLSFSNLIISAAENALDGRANQREWNVPRPLMEFLENNHNESQLEAIQACLSRRRIVLIQGPPGTGKTQTILGLLSAILHSVPARMQGGSVGLHQRSEITFAEKYNHWTKSSPWLSGTNPRDAIMPMDGDDGFFPTTGNELKPDVATTKRKYRAHILVCAPSNSALDEIVLRVMTTGISDENSHNYIPSIVRIGLNPHHSVQAVSMDHLVEQKLADANSVTAGKNPGDAAGQRDHIRASIIDEAAIVFSTLSFSGSGLFTRMNRVFDVVVIDEAAQAIEPATLIPLAHGCKQAFLVGDPIQLPATVISTIAEKYGYGMSLFKRFQMAGYPVHMLKTQYRMHPEIRSFPSKEFYSEALDDGPDILLSTKRPWHAYRCFGPFCFLDIDGIESQPSGSGSRINVEEVEFILVLYHNLVARYPELKSSSQLAVISPYRHQVKLLRERFRAILGERADQFIDINTVDGFQGREKDVAIFSCVRANVGEGIGFVSDFRRMNVGITRARSSVLVVGSASTLVQDTRWKNLVIDARERKCLFKVSQPYSTFFGEESLNSMRPADDIKREEQLMVSKQSVNVGASDNIVHISYDQDVDMNVGAADHDPDMNDAAMDADDYGGCDDE